MTADAERASDAAARRASARRLLVPGLVLVALSCVLGAWILARGNDPFVVDAWWNDLLTAWVSPVALGVSRFMNAAGGGLLGVLILPLALAALLLLLRRPWAAAYFVVAEIGSAGGVQALKHLFGRARPENIIVISDFGSFPSGHVANAATIAAVAFVLFPRVWTAVAGAAWVVLMAFSRTYLHAHWLSDTLGGALIGCGAALLVAAAFAGPLLREHRAVVARPAVGPPTSDGPPRRRTEAP
ncbi:phosphatase PAP2 family protein [Microbacterium sp.]|uniref:phosphatase PAP2 family protein n=1 Tax=Microbacterium sp. TaxID=51671 RepID=UPI001AD43C7C|nr:phosphatase PAP2 family protein [Microbacterium sp.]MBN9193448.1 phosphatase PAP2 family protein [Microbacterium sp.]